MDLTKLDIAAPRYTSYPTVPYWENNLDQESWKLKINHAGQAQEGISLYIHLPFCESLCTYCACNTRITINHTVEEGYVNSLLKEWTLYLKALGQKPRIKEIHLGGGTPTFFSPQHLERLLKTILSTAEVHERYDFSFEGHPSNTTREHLETLFHLGFKRVSFGVQDFDEQVQEAINRYQTFEEVESVISTARKIGYHSINVDLVYGLPFQTEQSVKNTLEKVIQLNPERIAFYSYAHVPWLKPGQRKYSDKDLPANTVKRHLYEMGRELFLAAKYEDVGMDHFALPGDDLLQAAKHKTLHRNFMGYTAQHTKFLIGLGASSISDSWDAFAQNIKTVEEYQKKVEEGVFPLMRGHLLSEEDLLLRTHILDLMCRYETTFSEHLKWKEHYVSIRSRLTVFFEKGWLEENGKTIVIKEQGKNYLRNIGLAFDERYWNKLPEKQVFSTTA
ncbi:MAG: oxygen-independent coproporphyrinogen III oxidase [Bacteroidia bacterium]|jgi:oxygen-independent coproporphyrinogen-3 oxidase|nr:oxygen-independent coproporphyrinogen III oxidase [Bacteroidia bacterium]